MSHAETVTSIKALQRWCIRSLAIGALLSLFLGGITLYLAFEFTKKPDDRCINLSLLGLGLAIGWFFGMMLSPGSKAESKRFSSVTKTLSAVLTGYLLAKLDTAISELFKPDKLITVLENINTVRLAIFGTALITTLVQTYVIRAYLFEWPLFLVRISRSLSENTPSKAEEFSEDAQP
jgi:hypothetical protein